MKQYELSTVLPTSKNFSFTGVDINQAMLDLCATKMMQSGENNGVSPMYGLVALKDLNEDDVSIQEIDSRAREHSQFDYILSCGTFLEGHVNLNRLPNICDKDGHSCFITSVRSTFINSKEQSDDWMERFLDSGYKVDRQRIPYLKGTHAEMLTITYIGLM